VAAHHPQPDRRRDQVRDGNGGHRQPGVQTKSEDGRQHAADTEAGDRGYRAGGHGREENECLEHLPCVRGAKMERDRDPTIRR
jgi:hypothetical protein